MAKLVIRTKGLPVENLDLKKGVNRLGRSSDNDFKIQHDTISRFHCEVEVKEDAMWARDLDSSNGTFLNDQPLEGRVQLAEGDFLRLGDVSLEVKGVPVAVDKSQLPPCVNHAAIPATMVCSQCKLLFCGACIHIMRRTGGKVLRLCPVCSGQVQSIQGMNQARSGLFDKVKSLFK